MERRIYFGAVLVCLLFLVSSKVYGAFDGNGANASKISFEKVQVDKFGNMTDSITAYFGDRARLVTMMKVEDVYAFSDKVLEVHFNSALSEYPIRDHDVDAVRGIVTFFAPEKYKQYKVMAFSSKTELGDLASAWGSDRAWDEDGKCTPARGAFRVAKSSSSPKVTPILGAHQLPADTLPKEDFVCTTSSKTAIAATSHKGSHQSSAAVHPWVGKIGEGENPTNGLSGKNIALWDSHGYYYEQSLLRWEWQRSRLFRTVEDLYTASYVLPYIVPMLENAGAYVILPRERDIQTEEIIVDNTSKWYSEIGGWRDAGMPGYGGPKSQYVERENPFTMGDARVCDGGGDKAMWMPEFSHSGEYAVYVSYISLPESSDNVHYTVHHAAGESSFSVNQRIGGNTWAYLGTFTFLEGKSGQGVTMEYNHTSSDKKSHMAVADAVRFGGGMGSIARKPGSQAYSGSNDVPTKEQSEAQQLFSDGFNVKPEVSGFPRYAEGARYWLQYAGFPQKVYSLYDGLDDYKDDYTCRAAWVNALMEKYDVPVDLTFALHSDAGTTPSDSTVGTLAIYTRFSDGKDRYKNGGGRIISREMADIVQTQVTEDVKALFDSDWSRRGLWDRSYFECRVPDTPSMIMELLSHQNFADMRYGHDPRFKFAVSRAIYKGILKFLTATDHLQYVVQPLPVSSFSAELVRSSSGGHNSVHLFWLPTKDPLEPSAYTTAYQVYVRRTDISDLPDSVSDGVFGTAPFILDTTLTTHSVEIPIIPGSIYSFKIVALNEGGRSFPSEILSVGIPSNPSCADTVSTLIVNGYTRIAPPVSFSSSDTTLAGFASWVDGGSPYISDISFTGDQYDFERQSPWLDDDAPGFGASYADYDQNIIAGNTFDFPLTHGVALMRYGIPFSSCSRDALANLQVDLKDYTMADFIMGKQVTTYDGAFEVFPVALRNQITEFCHAGGRLLVSGSYIATDIWDGITHPIPERTDRKQAKSFAENILKYKFMTGFASRQGTVRLSQNPFGIGSTQGGGNVFNFYTQPNPTHYCVESPDALLPVGPRAWTFLRYSDNNTSAAVAYRGDTYRSVAVGFPLETLTTQSQIDSLMRLITDFLLNYHL